MNIPSDYLQPVTPRTNDRVKVISGDYREHTGTLQSVDGSDGVVVMDNRHNEHADRVKLFPVNFLCKLYEKD